MKLRGRLLAASLLLSLAVAAPAAAAKDEKSKGKSLKSEAKIGMKEARAKALEKVPGGRVKSSELERENGKLVYSFDIRPARGTGIDEVQIDAVTGEVVSVEHETPAKERAEKRAERKEAKRDKH
jgi:uncharacterized membrane protein YkoI